MGRGRHAAHCMRHACALRLATDGDATQAERVPGRNIPATTRHGSRLVMRRTNRKGPQMSLLHRSQYPALGIAVVLVCVLMASVAAQTEDQVLAPGASVASR